MQIANIIRNDPEYVAGFDAAIEEVHQLIWHTENPLEAIKAWVQDQTVIIEGMHSQRSNSNVESNDD